MSAHSIFMIVVFIMPSFALSQSKILIVDEEDNTPKIKIGTPEAASKKNRARPNPPKEEKDQIRIKVLERDEAPVLCKDSRRIQKLNKLGNSKSTCFTISESGVVTLSEGSPSLISFEKSNFKIKAVCNSQNSKRISFDFTLNEKGRLATVVAKPGESLRLDYDEEDKCFDITSASKPLKMDETPRIVIPTNPGGAAR